MTSKSSTARRALLPWRGPTRCQRGPGIDRDLGGRLLDPVLAEHVQAGRHGVAEPFRRDGLGHRDQRHPGRIATGTPTGTGDPPEHDLAGGPIGLDPVSGSILVSIGRLRAGPDHLRRRKLGISRSSAS